MKSIKELYKIGYGPSSSHTMGIERGARLFKKENLDAISYEAYLYGSLALTGKGHLTDKVIEVVLKNVEVHFSSEVKEHPNTVKFIAHYDNHDKEMTVYSIGGGDIIVKGRGFRTKAEVYKQKTFKEIKKYCKAENIRLSDYVLLHEPNIGIYLNRVIKVMTETLNRGLKREGLLPGELKVKRRAKVLFDSLAESEDVKMQKISAYAFAVAEENASAESLIVTTPTCGSSGVLPALFRFFAEQGKYTVDELKRGLMVAGIIGNLVKQNASISGAVGGCQAEIGTATAMAAAFVAELYGYSIEQIEYAAEIAIEHQLGLTCDPIKGYVQIPCIERNAVAALRALDSARLARILVSSRKISLDMVIETMKRTGFDMHEYYRETSFGGLAKLNLEEEKDD